MIDGTSIDVIQKKSKQNIEIF